MARIPDAFIDDLLARTDLAALVGESVQLKRAGKEYQACCPFHSENSPSFTVSPAKGFYHCFGCGANGTAITWLIEHEKLEFREAVALLASRVGMAVPESAPASAGGQPRDDKAALLAACNAAAGFFREQLQSDLGAQEYLLKRGISPEAVSRFGIGYAPNSYDGLKKALGKHSRDVLVRAGLLSKADSGHAYDKFRGRIMFPILDKRGRVIAFGGRAISEGASPKYLNSPETPLFQKGRELFGLPQVLQDKASSPAPLVVVEGYIDVTALDQAGVPNVVATLGTAVTDAHVAALFATNEDVVFCFDGDAAGRRAAWHAVEVVLPAMLAGRQASFAFLPAGHDPDSLIRDSGAPAFVAHLDAALPLSEYLFQHLKSEIRGDGIEARAKLVQRATPMIERIPAGVFRDLMLARLSELTGARLASPPPLAANVARRTPVREAITLLLQSPQLAAQLQTSQAFGLIAQPGASLLAEIIDYGRTNPEATTADVLANFADRSEAGALRELANADLQGETTAMLTDLQTALGKLDRAARQRRIKLLQEQGELTQAERAELVSLLKFDRAPKRRGPNSPISSTRH